ncbi:MAG: 50S ribosomal protein L16 [Candidatus ainarchaeum sp.]|nr:50S ribosomal protein L16 [Candidatus ainarchaeum sp.]
MGLRPAKTFRDGNRVAWARFSRRRPRKSFVKSMPHNALNIYVMGEPKAGYEVVSELVASCAVQVRDNALESARQAVNKHLEKALPGNYHFKVLVFPHNVIRENKMIAGAGADRLQSGMAHPYGRPTERGARVKEGQKIFSVATQAKDVEQAKEAFRRAKSKLSGQWRVEFREA